jgi:hypothetical protein
LTQASPFDEIVARIQQGLAPTNVRAAAARGALPLSRPALIRLQILLLGDSDPAIAAAARQELDALDPAAVREVLAERGTPAEVLAFFAKRAARDESLAEKLAFHPVAPLAALAVLAATGSAAVVELVLTNEERLLAEPLLVERLMTNPALRPDQRARILELLERMSRAERRRSEEETRLGEGRPEADSELALEELAGLLEVDVGELLSASEILGAEEFAESEDPQIRDAFRRILRLNTAQKAILAMRGGREERLILIRDSNRTVALGVLKNGRLTEPEVEAMAKMRSIHSDVLRQIAKSREWTRSATVISSLVNNPRTPQDVTMNFVNRLSNHDLKVVATNRDVPELIRRMAKRTLDTRTQPARGPLKKKK